ncbi:uncharacterized protein PHACADRAFT_106852 [Phanerochaete carnosa HHB-10118-sp]|uniref:SNF2 N-terminal domain-containing protein n=1 Tax=Phanerochaete carnosa (strain HHB-10118-sp) TaxID=650164 RepID=K5UIV2_PHACS|nr:uncharacterized protein PHACADRAFT_106852 [Phanerochaete carnosa HHB-10118-sp]EKM49461.1 hypothetical protein PHACADRAFT_106852 [Phanerochaete carnosa HHB-10118-sp]
MVQEHAITDVENNIKDLLESYQKDPEHERIPGIRERELKEWDLDAEIEDLVSKSEVELWRELGIPNGAMPQMARWRDPLLEFTTWGDGEKYCAPERRIQASLKWHQIVGVRKMAESMFDNRKSGFLNLDEVGLGKTLQVISLLAYRINVLAAKEMTGKYLGVFENSDAQLIDGYTLIVVPTTLLPQWVDEMQRWIQYGSIELTSYTGQYSREQRKQWWETFHEVSKVKPRAKVIIATRSVSSLHFCLLPDHADAYTSPTGIFCRCCAGGKYIETVETSRRCLPHAFPLEQPSGNARPR